MVPDAVLSAFVQAKGVREATREIAKVQESLREAKREADLATAAVNRFGRTRGIAVLDVNAAKAKAATAAAAKEVNGFSRTNGTAVLDANGNGVTRATKQATEQVRAFGGLSAEARADLKIAGATAKIGQLRALLADLGAQDPTIEVQVRAAKAVADLERVEAQRRKLTDGLRDVRGPAQAASRALSDVGGGGRDGGNGVRSFAAAFGDLPGRIFLSTRLLGALMNILVTMAPVLLGLAAQLVAVVSALGPLVGLAAGAAGAMVAAAQGFGVLKLATMGVGDALKEQIKNQTQAGASAMSNASAQRSAARAIQSAQEGVRSAVRAVSDAQRDHREAIAQLAPAYTSARRALADMRSEARSSVLSVARMTLGLQDARKALQDLISGPSPLDMADAQDAVADATRGVDRAMLNLTDAQSAFNAAVSDPAATSQDLARARQDLRDAENAVGDARREATRAAEALAALEKPASSRDLADARLSVREAEAALSDARRQALRQQSDLNAAEAAGIAGSLEVLDARRQIAAAEDRLREARRQVTQAQQGVRDAQLSANEAMTAGAAAATKLNEDMSKLPDPAQAFVRQLQAMKPRLDELRATAAGGFFPGASAGLTAAMGSFQSVNRVVGQTSTVLGEAARKSGELVGSSAFGKDIEIIGGRNAKVLGTLGEALRHVISAFRHVLVAAGPLTQWLADVANKWALNAAEAAKAGRESGKMADFFDRARETAQKLGAILSNLASGLFGVGKASSATGRDILDSLDRLTARFAEWANSARGRNEIAEFMDRAHSAMRAIGPPLGELIKAFASFSMHVLPAYARILTAIGPAMDELVTIFLAWKIAATGAAIATGLLKGVMAVAAFVTKGWVTAFWALNAAMAANPIGLVVIAVLAIAAALVLAYNKSETFRKIVDGALRAVGDAFTWMWNAAKDVFQWLKDNWSAVTGILTSPISAAVTVIREFGPQILGAAKWLLDQFVAGVTAGFAAVKGIGGWIVGRVVEGVKAIAGFAADVGGWLKNRVVEGVHSFVSFYGGIGGWIVGKIVAGIKAIAGLAADVGGWIKNRLVEGVHSFVSFYGGIGGWILRRIVDGVKALADFGSDIGGWVKNRLVDGFNTVKDGVMGIGGSIIGWIVGGLKKGANKLVGFLNDIIGIINKIPGVDIPDIPSFKVDKDAKGGTFARTGAMPGATQMLAHGGAFARTGGLVSSPITLMGEEAPRHPEFVIPTNPAYRDRAQMLVAQAAGAVGLAEGGVIDAFRGAIKSTGAGPKPSLALWMAGIVESGLRNLNYGDADSLGVLQLRESLHGRALAMDPYRSAQAFLTRGFTGAGGAIHLSRSDLTAGQVAQAVQGSAFPDRYDAVRGEAMKYLKGAGGDGGGPLGAITGALGKVGGVLGDLLSKGAGFLLDKLPGVGDLPDWLKGTGKYVLGKAGDFIKDKVGNLLSSVTGGNGGAALPDGVSGDIKDVIALAQSRGFARPSVGQLTGGQHAAGSYHYQGRAADFGDAGHSVSEMLGLFAAIEQKYGAKLKELFYDKSGHYIKNGQSITGQFGGHGDHIHAALAQGGQYGTLPFGGWFGNGGTVPGPTGAPTLIGAHGGERVSRADDNDALIASNDRLAAELRDLRMRGVAVVTLTDQVGTELGDRAARRSATAGDPNITHIAY